MNRQIRLIRQVDERQSLSPTYPVWDSSNERLSINLSIDYCPPPQMTAVYESEWAKFTRKPSPIDQWARSIDCDISSTYRYINNEAPLIPQWPERRCIWQIFLPNKYLCLFLFSPHKSSTTRPVQLRATWMKYILNFYFKYLLLSLFLCVFAWLRIFHSH